MTAPEVTIKAIAWWRTKRPVGFTERDHLKVPAIKVVTPAERELCFAVADYLVTHPQEIQS